MAAAPSIFFPIFLIPLMRAEPEPENASFYPSESRPMEKKLLRPDSPNWETPVDLLKEAQKEVLERPTPFPAQTELFQTYRKYSLAAAMGQINDLKANGVVVAEDIVSEIESKLSHSALLRYDKAKGKYRTFLREIIKNHILNALEKSNAQKRGGGCLHVPLSNDLPNEASLDMLYVELAYEKVMADCRAQMFDKKAQMQLWSLVEPWLLYQLPESEIAKMAKTAEVAGGKLKALHKAGKVLFQEKYTDLLCQQVSSKSDLNEERKLLVRYLERHNKIS